MTINRVGVQRTQRKKRQSDIKTYGKGHLNAVALSCPIKALQHLSKYNTSS